MNLFEFVVGADPRDYGVYLEAKKLVFPLSHFVVEVFVVGAV